MQIWHYLELAAETAKLNTDLRRHCLGAVAIRKDGAIVTSRNGSIYMGRETCGYPQGHAEFRCLQKAGIGAIFFVARVKNGGDLGLAKPCPFCQSLLSRKVSKVFYTINNDNYGILNWA